MQVRHFQQHEWTEADHQLLRAGRGAVPPTTYGEMALMIGCTEMAARVHARRFGFARAKPKEYVPVLERGPRLITPPEEQRLLARRGPEPLPAGHKETWGLLTQGTLLEGVPWPTL